VSSLGHAAAPVAFDDIHFERRPYDPAIAYRQSESANALSAVWLDRLGQAARVRAYEWTALSFQEQRAAGTAGLVFLLALTVVYLILSALYESWSIPLAVSWQGGKTLRLRFVSTRLRAGWLSRVPAGSESDRQGGRSLGMCLFSTSTVPERLSRRDQVRGVRQRRSAQVALGLDVRPG